jgi:mRNA-degrading endonuclease RelE of RelBE toxin-antitoxin system
LKELPAKQAAQIAEKLKILAADPKALPSEPLHGFPPLRRAKSGEYRIIFVVEEDTVFVRFIGKRNDDEIYKAISRALRT